MLLQSFQSGSTSAGASLSFHRFPADQARQKRWLQSVRRDVGRDFQVTSNTRVCQKHFLESDYAAAAVSSTGHCGRSRRLCPSVVPGISAWSKPTKPTRRSIVRHVAEESSDVAATETERVSSELQDVDTAGSSAVRQRGTSTITLDSTESMSLEDHGKAVDADHDYHEAGELQRASAEYVERLEQENATLTAQLSVVQSQSMSLEVVKTDDERFKRLTGLPNYCVLLLLCVTSRRKCAA